ncbi:MAG TPA: hypothetical protein VGS58_05730, partial [Candidatus Sulfopaludibacter sp.]|nr:hypothetical protein [Candidatus Sulfopaludibacter sp.]
MRASMKNGLQLRYEEVAHKLYPALPLSGPLPRMEAVAGLCDRRGPVHGGAFLREGRIAFDCTPAEFPRIFVHELFHFAWLRAGNAVRRSFEELLRREHRAGARGELGWSSAWRKQALDAGDIGRRTRRWREYCCESFCDTAAWLYSGIARHPEFTLAGNPRRTRRRW